MSKSKNKLSEEDYSYPYRIVAPSHSSQPARLRTKKEADKYFESVSDQGHQAILSYIDPVDIKLKLVAYNPPSNIKRKE
ncbi:hypothetical protein [Sphingobacterium griseoflavum]|uniref:Uncharacterized protein n=1 Tax=Sphingobacterium griseoflavum TaxID=1474952 RepID=A0ABQ3HWM1_9SPHI|nr:hypothetical protein [Sphingobacterium griseoflavum]GHE35122.1 hypothetical protein GCM10017764_17940 [Sphingobacterium griseoflavum]